MHEGLAVGGIPLTKRPAEAPHTGGVEMSERSGEQRVGNIGCERLAPTHGVGCVQSREQGAYSWFDCERELVTSNLDRHACRGH